jgi:hypothetical protein
VAIRTDRSSLRLPVAGNTALHLAMESGHGEAAITLIEAGADRERVRTPLSRLLRLDMRAYLTESVPVIDEL